MVCSIWFCVHFLPSGGLEPDGSLSSMFLSDSQDPREFADCLAAGWEAA
jgi:hypothetical protein